MAQAPEALPAFPAPVLARASGPLQAVVGAAAPSPAPVLASLVQVKASGDSSAHVATAVIAAPVAGSAGLLLLFAAVAVGIGCWPKVRRARQIAPDTSHDSGSPRPEFDAPLGAVDSSHPQPFLVAAMELPKMLIRQAPRPLTPSSILIGSLHLTHPAKFGSGTET